MDKLDTLVPRQRDLIAALRVRFRHRPDFVDQIMRASRSIANNYHEGYGCRYPGDKFRFVNYAKRSCSEVLTMLDEEWLKQNLPEAEHHELVSLLQSIDTQLYYFMLSIRKRHPK